jgi:hypothetical protein
VLERPGKETMDDVKEDSKKARYFLSRAFLLPLEKGVFGLFRSMLEEDPETKKREKVGEPIGPIRLLRTANKDEAEKVVIRTVHPKTQELLELVEYEG